ncbi:OLC1v1012813C1 [Oldenlandia corymbosa var. corymbosa]|uniref:OLC1v1012813C1 n=1 Tax=Oldenlandia corymbosa var. corymbosa TaxID=529605 RepID=A0AAV1DYP3_OLDCO|nr:OLC1v1012813C1 [Oldenlandia corymbosa var. corymbosa]
METRLKHQVMSPSNVEGNKKKLISLGLGDPTVYSCFRTDLAAKEAVSNALLSGKFNGYYPPGGLPETRKAIAEYLSADLPYELSPDDVFVASGCTQAIDMVISVLARPGANVLLPRPGFPSYGIFSSFRNIEARYYDLLPDNGWEVNLETVKTLADQNTIAVVVINPGNPCGNAYTRQHLEEIAETVGRLGIPIIADEVYGHLAFGANPFVPMGVFGSKVQVFTLGSLSKRWLVPGWCLGWLVMNDPSGEFRNPKLIERVNKYCTISGGPASFIQAAVPQIMRGTNTDFFANTINIVRRTENLCYEKLEELPSFSYSCKAEGSMVLMAKLNLSVLEDIGDDIEFCLKLAKEESLIILPGIAVGLKNWIRVTFAADPESIEEALGRLTDFSQRHIKQATTQSSKIMYPTELQRVKEENDRLLGR